MFRVRFILILFTSAFLASSVSAQETDKKQEVRVVNGSIPIPFVVVWNISTNETRISNAEGLVLIPKRNPTDTLIFNSMGFENVMILPGEMIGKFLPMDEKAYFLDEVRITSNATPDEGRIHGLKGAKSLSATSIKNRLFPGNTAELLQNSGQIHVQQSQQGGGSPILRGFEANRVLLVIDGVRMNNAIYRSGHLQNSITVDPNTLSQVQIILGPSSVRFGSDALGGVVHFQTRRPRFRSSKSNSSSFVSGSFSSQFKSVNGSKNHNLIVETRGARWGSITSFSLSNYGDLKMGSRRSHGDSLWGLVPYYIERINGFDSLQINSDSRIQKFTGYQQKDFLQKVRIAIPGGAIETNIQYSTSSDIPRFDELNEEYEDGLKWAEWNYGPQQRLMTALSWEQYLGIPGSIHTTIAYQNIIESRKKRKFGAPFREVQTENVDVISLSSLWESSPSRGDGWNFEMGIDGQWNGVESRIHNEDPDTGLVLDTLNHNQMSRYPDGGSTMTTLGAFTSAKRTSGERIYHLGLRYSFAAITAQYTSNSFIELPFLTMNQSHGALTGSIAAETPISEVLSSVTSLASGFRHPNIDDAAKIREKRGFVQIPNDTLKSEYLYSLDESITWHLDPESDKLTITASGFLSLWTDAIAKVNSSLGADTMLMVDGDLARIQRNENVGNALVSGTRIEIRAQILPHTNLKSTYNFTRGRIIASQDPLAHIPPFFGRTSLEHSHKTWKLEAYILYNGAKDIEDYDHGNTDNPEQTLPDGNPSWWIFNIESHLELQEQIQISLGITNILDQHYKSFGSGISAAGRGAFVSLHASF